MKKMDPIRSRISLLRNDIKVKLDEIFALEKQLGGGDEEPMTNPVILSKVFSFLDLKTLVDLRLVCKVWNEVVITSPEFSKRIYLRLPRLFLPFTVAPVPKINSKLARNIYIDDRYWDNSELRGYERGHDLEQMKAAAVKNLMAFFDQYHHYVENIKFHGEDFDYFNILVVKAINALDFPKLQGIVIKVHGDKFYSGPSTDWDQCAHFSTRPNIRSLQLNEFIDDSRFQGVFQKLINCAMKLEEITIRGYFHPDLSTCKNLKILNYSGKKCYHHRTPLFFNLSSLSNMLDQVKHSIIKLSLEDWYVCACGRHRHQEDQTQLEEFKFPDVVKNLEFLRIEIQTVVKFGKPYLQQELKKLNPFQFPKLKNLSIRVKDLSDVIPELSYRFVAISSLHLSGFFSPELSRRIPILFPNLTSLTIPWSVDTRDGDSWGDDDDTRDWDSWVDDDDTGYEKSDFDAVIDFCSGWKLRKLDISTAMQFDWSKFMTGLGRLKKAQNDLRMVVLRSRNDRSEKESMFEVWYDSKKQQQPVTVNLDIKNLIFASQSMKKAMEGVVLEFILKHPVKVHFI